MWQYDIVRITWMEGCLIPVDTSWIRRMEIGAAAAARAANCTLLPGAIWCWRIWCIWMFNDYECIWCHIWCHAQRCISMIGIYIWCSFFSPRYVKKDSVVLALNGGCDHGNPHEPWFLWSPQHAGFGISRPVSSHATRNAPCWKMRAIKAGSFEWNLPLGSTGISEMRTAIFLGAFGKGQGHSTWSSSTSISSTSNKPIILRLLSHTKSLSLQPSPILPPIIPSISTSILSSTKNPNISTNVHTNLYTSIQIHTFG